MSGREKCAKSPGFFNEAGLHPSLDALEHAQ